MGLILGLTVVGLLIETSTLAVTLPRLGFEPRLRLPSDAKPAGSDHATPQHLLQTDFLKMREPIELNEDILLFCDLFLWWIEGAGQTIKQCFLKIRNLFVKMFYNDFDGHVASHKIVRETTCVLWWDFCRLWKSEFFKNIAK